MAQFISKPPGLGANIPLYNQSDKQRHLREKICAGLAEEKIFIAGEYFPLAPRGLTMEAGLGTGKA